MTSGHLLWNGSCGEKTKKEQSWIVLFVIVLGVFIATKYQMTTWKLSLMCANWFTLFSRPASTLRSRFHPNLQHRRVSFHLLLTVLTSHLKIKGDPTFAAHQFSYFTQLGRHLSSGCSCVLPPGGSIKNLSNKWSAGCSFVGCLSFSLVTETTLQCSWILKQWKPPSETTLPASHVCLFVWLFYIFDGVFFFSFFMVLYHLFKQSFQPMQGSKHC